MRISGNRAHYSKILIFCRISCLAVATSMFFSSPVLAINLPSDQTMNQIDDILQKHMHQPSETVGKYQGAVGHISTAVKCATEIASSQNLCMDTIAEKGREKIEDKVGSNIGSMSKKILSKIGKVAGKMKGKKKMVLKTVIRAGKQAGRLAGPIGQVVAAWQTGSEIGAILSENIVQPAMEKYYRKKEKIRAEKDKQGMALLRSDKSIALEYRRLLGEKGADKANAFLDRKVEGQVDGSQYDKSTAPYSEELLVSAVANLDVYSDKRRYPVAGRGLIENTASTQPTDSMQLLMESTTSLGLDNHADKRRHPVAELRLADSIANTQPTGGSMRLSSVNANSPDSMSLAGLAQNTNDTNWPQECYENMTPACSHAMTKIAAETNDFTARINANWSLMSESELVKFSMELPKKILDHLSACYASETRSHCQQAIRQQIKTIQQFHQSVKQSAGATW